MSVRRTEKVNTAVRTGLDASIGTRMKRSALFSIMKEDDLQLDGTYNS